MEQNQDKNAMLFTFNPKQSQMTDNVSLMKQQSLDLFKKVYPQQIAEYQRQIKAGTLGSGLNCSVYAGKLTEENKDKVPQKLNQTMILNRHL